MAWFTATSCPKGFSRTVQREEKSEIVSQILSGAGCKGMSGDLPNSHTPGPHLDLALKASEGDDVAARTLFAEFYKPLRNYVQLRMNPELQSRLDASDIVQETLLEANRRLKEYLQGPVHATSYLDVQTSVQATWTCPGEASDPRKTSH